MDMVSGIAAASIGMSSSRIMNDVNVAVLGKALDTTEVQGEALIQMMEQAVPQPRLLDVYA